MRKNLTPRARAITANARRGVLVSDRRKFGRSAPVRIRGVGDLRAAFALAREQAGVVVEVAGASGQKRGAAP